MSLKKMSAAFYIFLVITAAMIVSGCSPLKSEEGVFADGDDTCPPCGDSDAFEFSLADGDTEVVEGESEEAAVCEDKDDDGYYAGTGCEGVEDCNDDVKEINPGADDICNFIDDDCDGQYDEDADDCPAPCQAVMDCNTACYYEGGFDCWETCNAEEGNEACTLCYDDLVNCGSENGCFPGGQWDQNCLDRYCGDIQRSCLGESADKGICAADYLPCADACDPGDEYCRSDCYYLSSFECRSCMQAYNDCLYDNDCVEENGSINYACFYQYCFDLYDVCIIGLTEPTCLDDDQDGYGSFCELGNDCDDASGAVHPNAVETCNGRDDDCDGKIDEKLLDCSIERKWAVLVYMAADNNLSDSALSELESYAAYGGSSDDVVVAIQIELSGGFSAFAEVLPPEVFERTWRMIVPRDGAPSLESLFRNAYSIGDEDITQPEALTDFLDWADESAKAEHSYLTLWDHGGGWTGALADDGSNDFMSMSRMREGLAESTLKPDVILFSACTMGMLEVLVELDGLTDYIVASEELSYGIPGENIVAALHEDPDATPKEIAELSVEIGADYPRSFGGSFTWAAWDMQGISALGNAVNELGRLMTLNLETIRPGLDAAMPDIQTMGEKSDKDLVDFVDELGVTGVTDLDDQLALVRQLAMDENFLISAIIEDGYEAPDWNPTLEDAHGLSIYLPEPVQAKESYLESYQELAICNADENGWDEFILAWLGEAELGKTIGDFRFDLTWTVTEGNAENVDLDLYVAEPGGGLSAAYMGNSTYSGAFSDDSLASGVASEWYEADHDVDSGSFFVFVFYSDTGGEGVTAEATLSFTDERFEDNGQTYSRNMNLTRQCMLGESLLCGDVQNGRCSDFWFVGKLVRDDRKHTLLPGVYSDFSRRTPVDKLRFRPLMQDSIPPGGI